MLRPDHHPLLEDATRALKAATHVRIQKKDADKQLVYGVVYAPGEIDSHGEAMMAEDIELMCHRFMKLVAKRGGEVIDMEHDNVAIAAYPVESYIETEDGKDWPKGSWIMAVKVDDPTIWAKIKKGLINGFSFEAYVSKLATVVEVATDVDFFGKTSKNEDHDHVFYLEIDEEGRIIGGCTSYDMGHRHDITSGTATELAQVGTIPAHAHRLPVL